MTLIFSSGYSQDCDGFTNAVDVTCFGGHDGIAEVIVTNGLQPILYFWDENAGFATTDFVTGLAAGSYVVDFVDDTGCTQTFTVFIGEPNPVLAQFDVAEDLIIVPYAVHFNNTSAEAAYFLWDFGNGQVSNDVEPADVLFEEEGDYDVMLVADIYPELNICADTFFFTISAHNDIFIPNGISPNGDGINDALMIKGLELYPDNEIAIFNRWGNQVYSASPYTNDWDGVSTK